MFEITSVLNKTVDSKGKLSLVQYEEKIIGKTFSFPVGIFGFENNSFYHIRVLGNGPINILETFPDDHIQFYIVNPYLVRSDYILNLHNDDYAMLKCPPEKSVAVFSIVTVRSMKEMTCNLLGPIVLNTDENIGCQCINQDDEGKWYIRHSVFTGDPVVDSLSPSLQKISSLS